MKKKIRKIIVTIIIVLVSVTALAIIAGTVYYNVVLKDRVKEIVSVMDEIVKDKSLFDDIKPYLDEYAQTEQEDGTQGEEEQITPTPTPSPTPTPKPTATPSIPKNEVQNVQQVVPQFSEQDTAEAITNEVKQQFENTIAPGESTTKNEVVEEPIEPTPTPSVEESEKKSIDDYDSPYEYVKDNTSASDFKRGVAMASRIDIGYVVGILRGGLTLPEKKELYRYLAQRFTEEEIYEGVGIFSKYVHLFE